MVMQIFVRPGFGARIRAMRQAAGLSQSAFARLVFSGSPSARNIGRLETEEVTPRLATLARIARVCNADLRWLAEGRVHAGAGSVLRVPLVGPRIARLRERRGVSRLALARASGLGASSRNVGRIESGEVYPRLATVERLARALGVTSHALVSWQPR
jgi:transcriptional regulator with XRE-family HTH domain